MRTRLLPLLLLLAAGAALAQQKLDPDVKAALVKAAALEAEDAVTYLNGLDDAVLATRVYPHLVRHLYWKKKDIDGVVTIARGGMGFCVDRAEKAEPAERTRLMGVAKTLAYDLGSFTWPGWGVEGMEILPEHLEAGRRAARFNLKLAHELEKGPDKLSYAHWLLGAQLLAAGEYPRALESFEQAKKKAQEAKDSAGATMCEGYAGMTLVLEGRRRAEGRKQLDAAVKALRENGSDDAVFYADQLGEVLETLSKIAGGRRPTRTWVVERGPVTLEVHASRTAQLYQVVDALPGGLDLKLASKDYEVLDRYRKMLARKGGDVLARILLTPASVNDALFRGIEEGHLTPEEMDALRGVLEHFEKRLETELAGQEKAVEKLVEGLPDALPTTAVARLARLCGVESLTVPVFPDVLSSRSPVADVRVQVARRAFRTRAAEIRAQAEAVPSLNADWLIEGLAIAFSREDPDHPWTPVRLLGIALRPILRESLEKGDLADLLPRAADAWKVLVALEAARSRSK
jgi:tetratricopeptide (TPR) repeat protein